MTSYRYMGGVWRVATRGLCSMGTLSPIPPTTLHQGTRKEGQDSRGPCTLPCLRGERGAWGWTPSGLGPSPFPVRGPCALCAQPRWRVRVGAGCLWDRAQRARGGGGADLTGVRDAVAAVSPALSPSSASSRVELLFGSPGSFSFRLKLRSERGEYHLFSKGLYSIYVPGPILSALPI